MESKQTNLATAVFPSSVLPSLSLGTLRKATNQDARQRNLQAALQSVYREGVVSRADISRLTGLTRATVSDLIAQLVRDGFVMEVGRGVSSGGKPPTLMTLNSKGRHILALDLSSHPFKGAVVDLRGEIVRRIEGERARRRPASLEGVFRLVERLREEASAPVLGIGVGTPGIVDLDGRVVESANLGWHGLDLRADLAQRFALPVTVANDAHVAALAEFGSRRGMNLAVVKIGVGIGAGIVMEGHLYRGDRPAAGEIGHIRVVDEGLPCTCGNSGCLETVASVPSIIKQALALSGRDVSADRLLWDAEQLTRVLGDAPVRDALTAAGRSIGAVLAHLVAILDLHQIVLALELDHAEEVLLGAVRDEVHGRILPTLTSSVEVSSSEHGRDLVLAGSAALVLRDRLGVVWQ